MKNLLQAQVAATFVTSGLSTVLALCIYAPMAMADDVGMPVSVPKAYTTECASCHTAYAPGLLPAKSWQSILNTLEKHYGSDASVDPKALKEISAWLQNYAASSRKFAELPPENRITNSEWFNRKHREIKKDVWLRASIKSRSNCMACHQQASKGDFDDDSVRIPR
ncbi:diheme cytochrome c [Undibacterium sp. Ren11W]|uniref:diheme cytochrome c n=1 Tax=Undibacterium sp. Ren11W TaxID=3413045 RepID=UPI003BF179F8